MNNISVLSLLIRNTFYKVLVVIILMISVEGFKFYKFINGNHDTLMNAEQMLDKIYFADYFRIAIAAIFFILCVMENRLDKQSSGTILRLRITTKQFFTIKTLYNAFCIALLFVVQIWTAVIMIKVYGAHIGEAVLGPQKLFMAFYRNEFLHNLLPMAEVGKWIKNILFVAAYSMQAAVGGKKNYVTDIWICIFMDRFMGSEIGLNLEDMFGDLIAVIIITAVLLKVFGVFCDDEKESMV